MADPGHPVPRVQGIPANLVAATVGVLTAGLGRYLERLTTGTPPCLRLANAWAALAALV